LMRLYIEATGNVSICGRWSGSNRYQLGNINNQSIKDIIADNHVIDEIKNKNKMTCDNCDCVYFNKAMVFVEENYKKNNRIEFLEK
ncbi:SPASM domain-containing protein, partial [Candidatus Woesearchaeota archaeon]|nr:SPASM domain-containing protein [Candidatus Woesearchaeota archaeon]